MTKKRGSIIPSDYEQNKSIDLLTYELYNYPLDSFKYLQTKLKIENLLRQESKYLEEIICIPSKFNIESMNDTKNYNRYDEIRRVNSLVSLVHPDNGLSLQSKEYDEDGNIITKVFTNENKPLFKKDKTFLEDDDFIIIPRFEAEYNSRYKQLVVACYITDNKNILLLESLQGRMSGKITMIQGHVSFTRSCYLKNQFTILRENLMREIEEELIFKDGITLPVPLLPNFTYNGYITLSESEHFGLLYQIHVPSINDIIDKIQTGEPDKHKLVLLEINNDLLNKPNLDTWVKLVIDNILTLKNQYAPMMI